jgi:hypothetical protein
VGVIVSLLYARFISSPSNYLGVAEKVVCEGREQVTLRQAQCIAGNR